MPINEIIQGSALENLQKLEADSVDLLCTDPPYALTSGKYHENHKGGFMNKSWDAKLVPVDTWKECLRVLKAGAFGFIMSSPRQDVLSRMIVRLEDAGFNTDFTSLYHTYASGFPKAADITKLIEKREGDGKHLEGAYAGFQPKPAVEVILTVMKPLSEKSYVDQALANKKGITWLDDCRIPYQSEQDKDDSEYGYKKGLHHWNQIKVREGDRKETVLPRSDWDIGFNPNDKGRFPANLLVEDDVLNDGKITKSNPVNLKDFGYKKYGYRLGYRKERPISESNREYSYNDEGSFSRYFSLDAWAKTLPFLLVPKPAKSEKGEFNSHPTVKSLKLMSYLITMGSREGDTILDPFCGSGTVLIAAHELHRKYLGIEISQEYCEIARERLRPHKEQKRIQEFTEADA